MTAPGVPSPEYVPTPMRLDPTPPTPPTPSDLATLLAKHTLYGEEGYEDEWECGCKWKPSPASHEEDFGAEMEHHAHVADAIEAAGWRQVPEAGAATSPNIEALVNLAAEHQNCTGCPTPWWLTRWLTDARMGGSR